MPQSGFIVNDRLTNSLRDGGTVATNNVSSCVHGAANFNELHKNSMHIKKISFNSNRGQSLVLNDQQTVVTTS